MKRPPVRYSALPLPPYRYEPGRAPHPTRDPRGHSYGSPPLQQPAATEAWWNSERFRYAVDLFNHGYWWEAHETLEPLWRDAGRSTDAGRFLQGLIQLAAAMLKHSMGCRRPARRLTSAGCSRLRRLPGRAYGVDVQELIAQMETFLEGGRQGAPRIHLTEGGGMA